VKGKIPKLELDQSEAVGLLGSKQKTKKEK